MTKHNLLLFLLFFTGITQRAIAQEAYAALSEDNTVLTFYYDTYKKARNGMSVGPFSSVANHKVTGREWNEYISSITRVVFDATFAEYRPTSTVYWFYECGVLTTITGIENLKTDNLTDVGGMFYGCSSITNLDLSSFNTSNVKYMDNMFYGCSGLTSLDVSNFNTNNVVNMGQMFFGCSSLTNLNVSYFNTSSVTNMNSMFNGCSSLTNLDVSKFNTEEVKDMSSIFSGCSSLTSLDLSHFNTKSVTDMRGMFSGCSGLTSLDVSNFNTSNVVIMGQMFLGCSGLISLNVSNFNTRNVTNMNGMFSGCSSLTDLDVSDFDTGNVTEMAGMFHNCSGLNKLDLSHFHTENVTDMRNMFSGCSNLTIHDLSNFKTNKVKYMNSMFLDCSGLKTIKINADNWVTSNVTMSEQMFFGCTSLVGGKGTAYNTNYVDKAYAHIDGGITYPGYFTDTDPASIHSPLLLKDLSSTCNTIKGRTTTLSFVAAYATSYQWYFASSNIASPDNDTAIEGAISPSYTYNATDIGMEHVYCVASNDKGSIISNICTIRVNSKEIFSWESPRGIPVLIGGLNTGPSNGDRVNYASTWNDITYYTICLVGKKADVDTDKYIELTPIQPFAAGDVIEVTGYYNKNYEMTVSMFFKYSNGTVVEDDTSLANIQGGVENIKTYTFIVPAEAAGSTSVRLTRNIAATNIYITKLVMANSKGDESTKTKYIAEYDDKTHVLTFKEGQLIAGESNVFDTADTGKQPGWNTYASDITSVAIDKSFAGASPASCRRWFSGLEHINMINGIEYLNTENVIDMSEMFHGCSNLTNLDLSNFNTSKVTDMGYMFTGCCSLPSLDVRNFNTSNVTDMGYMFSGCMSLTSLDLSNFNTTSVMDMSSMFYGCIKLKTIFADEGWNTKAVKLSTDMFLNCIALSGSSGTTYDGSHTDVEYALIDGGRTGSGYFTDKSVSPVVNAEAYAVLSSDGHTVTFYYDTDKDNRIGAVKIYQKRIGQINEYITATNAIIDRSFADYHPISTAFWFSECTKLTSISGFEYLCTSNTTDMCYMFSGCGSLTSLNLSNFNTSNVTDMGAMFKDCSSLISLDVSRFNTSNVTNMGSMFSGCSSMTMLDVSNFNTANVRYMSHMFSGCGSLTSLDVSNFNTSNVTNMISMFRGCSSLTSLDVSNFNTSKVTNMASLFSGCSSLTSLDVSNFDTSNVTYQAGMSSFFSGCSSLTSLDLSNFNTANVTRMNRMFFGCSSLVAVDLSNFNTSNVTDMGSMFSGCSSLITLDLSSFYTSNVTSMDQMLQSCTSLKSIRVGEGWNTDAVTEGASMFENCTALVGGAGTAYDANLIDAEYARIDGGKDAPGYFSDKNVTPVANAEAYAALSDNGNTVTFYYDTQKAKRTGVVEINKSRLYGQSYAYETAITAIIDASFADYCPISTAYWFIGCSKLTSISGLDFLNTSNVSDMSYMFTGCISLTSLDVSKFNTSNVADMSYMFDGCISLPSLDVSKFNTDKVTGMGGMFKKCRSLTSLDLSSFNTSNVMDMQHMFSGCSSLKSLDVSNFNTSNVTKMSSMFYICSSLTSLDVSNFNTSNVTDMSSMFEGCSSLTSFELSNFDTPNVTNIREMFSGCTSLISLNLRNFSTSNVTSMISVFKECSSLSSLDLSKFNTSNVTNMGGMFYGCSSLTSLDVSNFDTGKVTEMHDMFHNCSSLISLDVSSFNTSNVTDMQYMFYNCRSLKTIFVSEGWTTDAVTSSPNMFHDCTALVGGAGTAYDANHTDAAYARIDGGTDAPGYFTGKNVPVDNVTLTAKNYTREYGEDNPAFEYEVTEGTITSGTPEITCEATASSPVGTYDIIISKGTVSNNGTVELVKGTLTITKAPLIISVESSTKEEGEDNPEFTLTYNGFKNGETEDVLSKQPTITTTATKESSAGEYDVKVSGAEAQNYSISYRRGTLTITAKPIEIVPVEEETKMNTEDLGGQDLSDNVVNDVYYNVGDGGYDATDQSIVISQPTNMGQIADKQPGSADVKENFNGMILKVAKGKGLITVNVKTSGNAQLVVQVGNGTPMLASKTEKGDVVFRYDVEEDTYVYIYAIIGSSAAKGYGLNATDTDNSVRIYGITVSPGATGIRSIGSSEKNDDIIYDLQGRRVKNTAKGVYIIGGRKYSVK